MVFLSFKANDTEKFLSIFIGTGLFMVIVVYLIVFAVVATSWVLILEKFTPGLQGDISFTRAFDALNIVIGFVYFVWLKQSFHGYTKPVRQFRNLIVQIRSFSNTFFGIFEYQEKKIDATQENTFRNHISDMNVVLQLFIFHSYRLFAKKNIDQFPIQSYNISYYLKQKLVALDQFGFMTVECRLLTITRSIIRKLDEESVLIDADLRDLNRNLNNISGMLDQIDVDQAVIEPDVFQNHVGFTLLVYFGLWTPVTMWISFGPAITIIIYPIVLFILTGPVIYRGWLGDPFDPKRPIRLGEHMEWRRDFMSKINVHATQVLKN